MAVNVIYTSEQLILGLLTHCNGVLGLRHCRSSCIGLVEVQNQLTNRNDH